MKLWRKGYPGSDAVRVVTGISTCYLTGRTKKEGYLVQGTPRQKQSKLKCIVSRLALLIASLQLGFDGLLGVRYHTQPLLRNQLTAIDAHAISTILDAHQGVFELGSVLLKASRQLTQVFTLTGISAVFQRFGGTSRHVSAAIIFLAEGTFDVIKFGHRTVQLSPDQLFEFPDLLLRISVFFFLHCYTG